MEGEREGVRERKRLHSISFLFETCFVLGQTAEGNILTASVSEGRRLFKLKSGLINASDYSPGKRPMLNKETRAHTNTHRLAQEFFWGHRSI